MRNKAFTLIELLVVVAIIGILAAVGVVAYNGYTTSAKINATKNAYKVAEKTLLVAATSCYSGIGHKFQNGSNCLDRPLSGDTIAWAVYGEMKSYVYKTNAYNSADKSVEWNQTYGIAYCPISRSAKIPKGQVVLGYGENGSKNYCRMGGGNMSCIRANIGDSDGNDSYLETEINMCDYQ
jgi:prepilin-type N-terminal cleavage/methylation domain-containing protein